MGKDKEKILVIAAHPDDEILGCAATLAKLSRQGHEVHSIIMGKGIVSRFDSVEGDAVKSMMADLETATEKAAEIIGIKKTHAFDFPDNAFDSVPRLEFIKVIEKVKAEIEPQIVFTHFGGDLNIDHRIVYESTLTAFRPLPGEDTRAVYAFETPSATEWQYPQKFNPNYFVNITETLPLKLAALKEYDSEMRPFPHPRSYENVEALAKHRGAVSGYMRAEAFETIRVLDG